MPSVHERDDFPNRRIDWKFNKRTQQTLGEDRLEEVRPSRQSDHTVASTEEMRIDRNPRKCRSNCWKVE